MDVLERAGVPHDDISLVSGDKDRAVVMMVNGGTTGTGAGTGGTVLGGGAGPASARSPSRASDPFARLIG